MGCWLYLQVVFCNIIIALGNIYSLNQIQPFSAHIIFELLDIFNWLILFLKLKCDYPWVIPYLWALQCG